MVETGAITLLPIKHGDRNIGSGTFCNPPFINFPTRYEYTKNYDSIHMILHLLITLR
jgi:hypothetical protein